MRASARRRVGNRESENHRTGRRCIRWSLPGCCGFHRSSHQRRSLPPPPFTDRRMARLVLYQDPRGWTHLRLFDGRPGSRRFGGVTPAEARDAIAADTGSRWGCFLDPGQTARICLNGPDGLTSYGNRHYLQWPGNTTGCNGQETPRAGSPGYPAPDARYPTSSPSGQGVPVFVHERRKVRFAEPLAQ